MLFGRKNDCPAPTIQAAALSTTPHVYLSDPDAALAVDTLSGTRPAEPMTPAKLSVVDFGQINKFPIDSFASLRKENRESGYPVCAVVVNPENLTALGEWLKQRATQDQLDGFRIVVRDSDQRFCQQLKSIDEPCFGSNVIKMPLAPEVENSGFRYIYMFSRELRGVVDYMRQLAENNINRIYLLGAPGAGKTSLAYYYYISRGKGNFVTVNLNAESTGDKASMKSLLCGHVSGAIAGSGSREGALSFAKDGVCFLDESHGVTGTVMQVLMEVLDSGQYLPFGATAKRMLECSVIFASNRSWEKLRSMIHLDEHARLGAMIVKISDLRKRPEDLAAVLSITLAQFKGNCTSWTPPQGLSQAAWAEVLNCQWRGNNRALIRVLETACVRYCMEGSNSPVLELEHIREGMDLWEPAEHPDDGLYTSI